MEKEITTTNQTTALADSLIVVQQLPIIKEQLHSIKAQAQESVKEALSLACTEETLKVVKERRAALNRDRKDLDARRMAVKKQIMQPFEDFDEVYKECVTDVYGPADEALKGKITDVEAGLKADKEKKVKDYFAEMVKASGVEWVTYEDVGVAVTLTASLKSLKAKVKEYVEKVAADVACINGMENAPEIMAEYKLCGSLAVAINSVSQRKDRIAREEAERKQRLEAQLRAQEAEKAVLDVAEEELSAPQVMGTESPVMDEQETEDSQKESAEQVVTAKFTFMASTFQCRGKTEKAVHGRKSSNPRNDTKKCNEESEDSSMIFTENLDHNPQAVTLEKLPDGTAWLYLRKDAHEVRTEAPEGEQGGTSWECTTALCKLGSDYAEETVESITAAADDWWVYAEAWTTADEAAPSLEERVSVLETLFMGGEL